MVRGLARLIGLTLLGAWVDGLPRVRAAWLRLAVVLVVFGSPVAAVASGAMGYSDVWWWLWLDAFVVGVWVIVSLVARRADRFSVVFFVAHYFAMFTLLPAVLHAWLMVPRLPLSAEWWGLVVLGAASLVVHGWTSRRAWWRAGPLPPGRAPLASTVYPYLRLAVVYAGLFLPLSIAGFPHGDSRPLSSPDTLRATLLLVVLKLVLEIVLALVHLLRTYRATRAT